MELLPFVTIQRLKLSVLNFTTETWRKWSKIRLKVELLSTRPCLIAVFQNKILRITFKFTNLKQYSKKDSWIVTKNYLINFFLKTVLFPHLSSASTTNSCSPLAIRLSKR